MKIFISIFILLISFNIFSKEITILEDIPGEGFNIVNHSKVKVHYVGLLEDGSEFDNSYKRGEPITFQIGTRQVIQGWEIGLLGMKIGGKRTILIPPDLGYGSRGAGDKIPPDSKLIFEIEIVDAILPGYRTIDSKQLLLALTDNFLIIDIRTEKDRIKTGIIPGSIELAAFDKLGNFNAEFIDTFNNKVKAYTYHNLNLSFAYDDAISLYLGIDNLANKKPAALPDLNAGGLLYDGIGRKYYAGMQLSF